MNQFGMPVFRLQDFLFHPLALTSGLGFLDETDKRLKVLSPLFEENGFIGIQNGQQVQPHQVFSIVDKCLTHRFLFRFGYVALCKLVEKPCK